MLFLCLLGFFDSISEFLLAGVKVGSTVGFDVCERWCTPTGWGGAQCSDGGRWRDAREKPPGEHFGGWVEAIESDEAGMTELQEKLEPVKEEAQAAVSVG